GPADQDQPYLYDLLYPSEEGVPSQPAVAAMTDSLATVTADYHSDVPDHKIRTYRASSQPWEIAPMRFSSSAAAPMRRTEYVTAETGARWASAVIWDAEENRGVDVGPWTLFNAGDQRAESSLAAPLVPGVESSTTGTTACPACRQGNELFLNITPWASGGRTVGGLSPSQTLTVSSPTRLTADGTLLAEADAPSGTVTLPSTAATMTLEVKATKNASWTTTSTASTTAWTWKTQQRSGTIPEGRICRDGTRNCSFEPLLFLSYDAGTDLANSVPAGQELRIGVLATHQPFETTGAAQTLTFDVSSDDGATWTPASVMAGDGDGAFTATLVPPAESSYLSFRVHASDPSGSTIDQTIVRAVKVSG
ncbi:MAG: hypothetical protein JXA67_19250, partial [Micromonosporaceae bacterium]|nr:hypothetical protein [Micromonosporaceae bacterium]